MATAKKGELSQAEIRTAVNASHIHIRDWQHFHDVLSKMADTQWIFRGVCSPEHYLIPSIGREAIYGHYKRAHEERLFEEFKSRAIGIITDPRFDDWDWLAFAQHLGVPTRLLDWTTSPLTAAFFALEADWDQDRVIYCVQYSHFLHEVDHRKLKPFENTRVGRFSAPLLFDRIRAQRGLFTIHPDPTKIFHPNGLRVLRIASDLVKRFRRRLFKYGVDYWSIYPDTQGLGLQLRWQFLNKIGLGSLFILKR